MADDATTTATSSSSAAIHDDEIGKLHLSQARLKRIMKADKDVTLLTNETIFLVGKATVGIALTLTP